MDPISLITVLNALVAITTTVMDKMDKLDRISNQEMRSAKQYKKALMAFSTDVEDVTVKFNAIVQYGNKASVSALLGTSDGQTSFKRLFSALNFADVLVNKQERTADALIQETEKRNSNNHLDLVALLSDVDKDAEWFNSTLSAATTALDDSRSDVLRLFGQFCRLYEIHSQAWSGRSLTVSPSPDRRTRSPGRSPLNSIQLSFYDSPFDIIVDESCALEIAEALGIITSDKGRLDRYTLTMKEMAERWVDDHVSEVTVATLGRTQLDVIQILQKVLDFELAAFGLAGPDIPSTEALRCAHLADIKARTEKEIARESSKKFSIAFCGMVKAGKSLFLNALTGRMILPSDELPSTAWPCRVQHVRGQLTPSLEIDAVYFQSAIESLQARKFGAMMEAYCPPKDTDLFSALLDDVPGEADAKNDTHAAEALKLMGRKREIYNNWIDLHPVTKSNLLKFEKDGYRIPESASGEDHVLDLLAQVNDVVRLCRRLNVPLPSKKPASWPLLKCEFVALRDEQFEGDFEFVDLPGVGESHSEFHSFEDLVRRVAKEVNAVVPVVSFKEVSKDDWRQQLPDIVRAGHSRPPELVLCTHLDQVAKDRVEQQVARVAKAFWPKSNDSRDRVLCCSSRMGFSARALLRQSIHTKPDFKDIWVENSIEYDCAEKILGAHKPELTFQRLNFDVWKKSVHDQLAKSGLQDATKRLVTDMVLSSHQRALTEEGARLYKQLHKAISNQHRMLLAMRRSAEDREQAYHQFETDREDFKTALNEWSLVSAGMQLESSKKLQSSYQLLEREGLAAVHQAVENMGKNVKNMKSEQQQMETNDNGELVFYNVPAAEVFLQQVQMDLNKSLSTLKHKFVSFVRTLANRSRAEHFTSLKSTIQGFIRDDVQPELKEEIIEELSDRGANVETLAFSSIRRKVMHTVATRHNAASAYRALQETFAKPFLKQRDIDTLAQGMGDGGNSEAEQRGIGIEELGFMLRAPIAVLAVVPWLLGSGIWPFMKRSEKYVLNKDAFLEELTKHIIRPFFDALKQEGQNTLESMMEKSSEAARDAVKDALASEEQRYESERSHDKQPSSNAAVASALNTLLNFIAAEAALLKLQEYLKGLPPSKD